MKRGTQIQQGQERWRLKFEEIESLQQLDLYGQRCLQICHCYCSFHREHPLAPVRPATETMQVDTGVEEAFCRRSQAQVSADSRRCIAPVGFAIVCIYHVFDICCD